MKNFGLVVSLIFMSYLIPLSASAQNFSPEMLVEQFRLSEQNVVLLENTDHIIPLKDLEKLRIAYVPVGFETVELNGRPFNEGQTLQDQLATYTKIDVIEMPAGHSGDEVSHWLDQLSKSHNLVILGIKNYTLAVKDPIPWKDHDALISKICKKLPTISIMIGRLPGPDCP